MISLPLSELAVAVGGSLVDGADPDVLVTAPASVDSRAVPAGGLFVAIRGEQVDGHRFALNALRAGAAAVLAQRPIGDPAAGLPVCVVDDPVASLGRLARHVVDRLPDLRVVAVTGSSGKTSTKDLLGVVLSGLGPTVAPVGSFNNELGLPLTALRVDDQTRILVAEMGARGIGHIAVLCAITPPDVGIVLNVGAAHIGEFGSREVVAAAKGEIVESLAASGTAVLNADDPLVDGMAVRTLGRVLTFGERGDVRATGVHLDQAARASFLLHCPDGSAQVRLRLHGEHHVSNALATAAAAHALGLPVDLVAASLAEAAPASRWRMEVSERADGVTLVNDAYNANPESMRAALKALVAMAGGRRSWAVLGEMRELGQVSEHEHDALGRLAVRLNVSRLVAVGAGARATHLGAAHEGSWGKESAWVPDRDAALALLRAEIAPGDVVLVKASRAVGLELIAEALLADEPAVPA